MDNLFLSVAILFAAVFVVVASCWLFTIMIASLIKPSITLWEATIMPFLATSQCFLWLKAMCNAVKGKIKRKHIAIIAVWISVIMMVFMTLYPPWLRILDPAVKTPIGYGFISHPPRDSRLVEIDTTRLILQYVIVIAPLFGLLYTLKKR